MNKNNQFNIGSRQMRTVGTKFNTREDGEYL